MKDFLEIVGLPFIIIVVIMMSFWGILYLMVQTIIDTKNDVARLNSITSVYEVKLFDEGKVVETYVVNNYKIVDSEYIKLVIPETKEQVVWNGIWLVKEYNNNIRKEHL